MESEKKSVQLYLVRLLFLIFKIAFLAYYQDVSKDVYVGMGTANIILNL
jgi:hypothetical protein